MLLQNIEHLPAVGCLGNYFKILLQSEQLTQTVAKDRMVVSHYDSDFRPR
jgi:hypothetical protein